MAKMIPSPPARPLKSLDGVELDPRVSGLFAGAHNRQMKLFAILLFAMAGPALTDAVLAEFSPEEVDMSAPVCGKPFMHFMGKTPKHLQAEGFSDKQIDEVAKAFRARGADMPGYEEWDDDDAPPPQAKPAALAGKSPSGRDPLSTASNGPAGGDEPTWAGKKLSELADLSDEQLLAIEGISPASITEIHAALAKAAKAAKAK